MKQYLKNYMLKGTMGVWVLAIILNIILFNWLESELDFIVMQLASVTIVIFVPQLMWWNVLIARAEYIYSPNMEVPDFSVVRRHTLAIKSGLSLETLTEALPDRFFVSQIDVQGNKIKLYDKAFWSVGIGYILELRPTELDIISFPISSHAVGAERRREKSVAALKACLS
ncbi:MULTISPECIES: hypothetical protein [unclassified Carboxylicivirga]|uniref:hypothetical protein n=1 Tax=Carboxylicivirga TaxID=1628153 RepID=UPI003D34D199